MTDRNFDDIADHFADKVANSHKGRLRRAVIEQDLKNHHPEYWQDSGKTIIDVGAGLGHWSIEMAKLGHQVVYNDISEKMTEKAQHLAQVAEKELEKSLDITFHHLPYQQLFEHCEAADLILCHAVVEWLVNPEELISLIAKQLKPGGVLSLCFYNPAGAEMRNLIMGNFKLLNREKKAVSDKGSLTPNNPCSLAQIEQWLGQNHLVIEQLSGIRVFTDYTVHKRGGLAFADQVEEMELKYAPQEPFNRMGRYIHCLVRKV